MTALSFMGMSCRLAAFLPSPDPARNSYERDTPGVMMVLLLTAPAADDVGGGHIRIPASVYHELKDRAGDGNADDPDEDDGAPRLVNARLSGVLDKRALSLELRVTVEGRASG